MSHLWLFGRTVRHPVRKPKLATLHETQGDSLSEDRRKTGGHSRVTDFLGSRPRQTPFKWIAAVD